MNIAMSGSNDDMGYVEGKRGRRGGGGGQLAKEYFAGASGAWAAREMAKGGGQEMAKQALGCKFALGNKLIDDMSMAIGRIAEVEAKVHSPLQVGLGLG